MPNDESGVGGVLAKILATDVSFQCVGVATYTRCGSLGSEARSLVRTTTRPKEMAGEKGRPPRASSIGGRVIEIRKTSKFKE